MKRIKDFLHFALLLAAIGFFVFLAAAVFVWVFGPYMAACFEFTKDWTIEEIAILGDAIENCSRRP